MLKIMQYLLQDYQSLSILGRFGLKGKAFFWKCNNRSNLLLLCSRLFCKKTVIHIFQISLKNAYGCVIFSRISGLQSAVLLHIRCFPLSFGKSVMAVVPWSTSEFLLLSLGTKFWLMWKKIAFSTIVNTGVWSEIWMWY